MAKRYTEAEVRKLAEQVRQQRDRNARYARERQQGYEEKQHLRLYELIVEVVRNYYGQIIDEVVVKIQRLLSGR
jgi:hypothetical protein